MPEIIAYYRVSTQMQGAHGLGMAAQRAAVAALAKVRASSILAEYEELETAKRDTLQNRPQLVCAVAHAKRARATLVIARFDRLARNVLVTSQLLESGVEFVACDNPYANRMTIQIISVMAEQESRLISERTKAAFAARKARGLPSSSGRLFTPEESAKGRAAAARSHRRRARDAYRDVAPSIVRDRAAELTLPDIVRRLDGDNERNQYGRPFDVQTVRRILARQGVPLLPPFLGLRNERAEAVRAKGVAAAREALLARVKTARDVARPVARELYASGATRRAIADHLNAAGIATHTGKPWTKATMLKLLAKDKPIRRDGCSYAQVRERVAAGIAAKRRVASEGFAPIRRIVEQLRSLKYSYADIATELNQLGYRPPTAERWCAYLIVQGMQRDDMRARIADGSVATKKNARAASESANLDDITSIRRYEHRCVAAEG